MLLKDLRKNGAGIDANNAEGGKWCPETEKNPLGVERVFRGGYKKGIGKGFRLKIGGRWRECRHSRQRMKKLQ